MHLAWSRWPLNMTPVCDRYFCKLDAVKPGQLVMYPHLVALFKLDSAGGNNLAWLKATSSVEVADLMASLVHLLGDGKLM